MTPEEGSPPFLTPGWAVMLTFFAAFLQGSIALILMQGTDGSRASLFGLASLVAYGLAFAIGAPRVPAPPGPNLGFRAAPTQAWLAVPFLVSVVLLASEVDNVAKLLAPPPPELAEGKPPEGLATVLEWMLVFALVIPVIEEVFFRGLLLPGLRSAWGPVGGVGFMALLNGAAASLAAGPWALAYATPVAAVLGVLRLCSASILPGLLLNVSIGFVAVLAARRAFGIPGFDDTSAAHTPLGYLLPAAFLVGIGLRLCRAAGRVATPVVAEEVERTRLPHDPD
jgi:membrane protease YdiL (CAAX protease family)